MSKKAKGIGHLPETPKVAHSYWDLASSFATLSVPDRAEPLRLHYKSAGEGPPLLLVHGLMTSSYSFRYVIGALAQHYHVIVPDLPGAGRSDAPVDLPMQPETVARVLIGLLEALELPPVYLVGNSMGGYLSLWLTLLEPARVRRLMVMHAPGLPEPRMWALRAALALPGADWLFAHLARDPERFVYRNVHYRDDGLLSLEEVRHYGEIFRDPDRRRVFVRILRETMGPMGMRRLQRRLRGLRASGGFPVPLALLWARHDVMVPPAMGPRYQRAIPEAELIWLEDTSHFIQVDQPARTVEAILRFDGLG